MAQDFAHAAAGQPGAPFREVRPRARGDDPPDCEALDAEGRRIAIEVTELVDEGAVRRAAKALPTAPVQWDATKLQAALGRLLTKKDIRERLKDGPWDEYIVVIYTAESLLDESDARALLSAHRFTPPKSVDRAYLSLDYKPPTGHPLIRLLW